MLYFYLQKQKQKKLQKLEYFKLLYIHNKKYFQKKVKSAKKNWFILKIFHGISSVIFCIFLFYLKIGLISTPIYYKRSK